MTTFAPIFAPSELQAAVDDQAWLAAMLEAERALTTALAAAGTAPADAVAAVADRCHVELYHVDEMLEHGRAAGNPVEPGLLDATEWLDRLRGDLAAQLGGAAGTLGVLGADGPAVAVLYARELGLAEPTLPWHVNRVRVAELGGALAALAGACGKIGREAWKETR